MKQRFGTKGEHLQAGIGPSISPAAYEVGAEVVDEVRKNFSAPDQLIKALPGNKAMLDLWSANKIQLIEFGVPAENIEIGDLCTIQHNNHFFSARRGDAGRFAAGIMLV